MKYFTTFNLSKNTEFCHNVINLKIIINDIIIKIPIFIFILGGGVNSLNENID